MDLARVKYCMAHIDEHPESLTHCNGVDMAYFLPDDVRALIAEVERLTAVIRTRPHGTLCEMNYEPGGTCDCWKAEAVRG